MKQTPRQALQWILAFAPALIFCSLFFARGGGLMAVSITASPAVAPDTAPDAPWWADDDKAGGISTPGYGGVERRSRYITMKDGVRRALDIYLPQGLEAGARLPTMLEQTRYNRSFEFQLRCGIRPTAPRKKLTEFVTRGYAYVILDVSLANDEKYEAETSNE